MGKNPFGLSSPNEITTDSAYRMDISPLLPIFIYAIGEMPLQPTVTLNDDEQILLSIHSFRCKAISLFLRWIRLGEKQSEMLLLPELQVYEPWARFCDSLLTLATEVHPKTDDGLIRAFDSPTVLWFACLTLMLDQGFAQALTSYPPIKPKRQLIENLRASLKFLNQPEILRRLEPSARITPSSSSGRDLHSGGKLTLWLLLQAGKIAADDSKFDRLFYSPCLRALRKVANLAHENKNIQVIWIDLERQISMTKQSKKRK